MDEVLFRGALFGGALVITGWKLVGYVGTFMFAGRWVVQWWAAKRAGRVVMPRAFWYMSVIGSLMTLSYFIWGKNDSVGIMQNLFPSFVACYNLWLDLKPKHPPAAPEATA